MHQQPDKSPRSKPSTQNAEPETTSTLQLQSNRPEHAVQHRMQALADQSPQQTKTAQLQQRADNHNRTGLPDQLKSGIEQASGFAMDDVKVHYNSSKPAQLQAHAFAQGTDIHLAPGQEKHLPHEAWHVVQQKQGRVNPTLQLQGIDVNDDTSLEKEADVMGQKALSGSLSFAGKTPQTTSLRSGRSTSQRKVVQRVSTQIGMDENDERIVHLVIRGRPPSIYQGSMGDHTTAFIVQTEGLNIALRNKTLAEAIKYMVTLTEHMNNLPGVKFLEIYKDKDENKDKASTENGKLFLHERQILMREVDAAHTALGYSSGDRDRNDSKEKLIRDMAVQHLQLAINAYLSARELVPFSTINVGALSKGTAGKGKGESAPAAVLSAYEQKQGASGIDSKTLEEAAFRLFDDNSANMLATQTDDHIIQKMTRGISLDKEKNSQKRMELIWEQHVATLKHMFPKVYDVIKDQLVATKLSIKLTEMRKKHLSELLGEIYRECYKLSNEFANYQQSYKKVKEKPYYQGALNATQLKLITGLYRAEREITNMFSEANLLDNQLGKGQTKKITKLDTEFMKISEQMNAHIVDYKEKEHLRDITAVVKGVIHPSEEVIHSSEEVSTKTESNKKVNDLRDFMVGGRLKGQKTVLPTGRSMRSRDAKEKETTKKTETAKESLGHSNLSTVVSGMSSMSIQITMNPEDGRISGMISKGRPVSPFNGTMGAHTTSWVVHLDRVRSRIKGKTIAEATKEILELLKEVKEIYKKRKDEQLGDKAVLIIDETKKKMNQYADTVNPDNSSLSKLQQMINAILSFYNLIPDVSVNKINTNGHGEGTSRQTLLKYEQYGQGSREDIQKAIKGLFDGSFSSDMYQLHGKFIQEAYPNAYKFSETGESTVKKQEIPAKKQLRTESDENSDTEVTDTTLSPEEVKELYEKSTQRWLASVNNCLINAITDGAGIERATRERVIAIREELNVPLGQMLAATQTSLDIITRHLGLTARGVVVFYMHEEYLDHTSNFSDHNPIFVLHDGVNHFTALTDQPPKKQMEFEEEIEEIKTGHKVEAKMEVEEKEKESRREKRKSEEENEENKKKYKTKGNEFKYDTGFEAEYDIGDNHEHFEAEDYEEEHEKHFEAEDHEARDYGDFEEEDQEAENHENIDKGDDGGSKMEQVD